jgi:hypothetical protein
VTKNNYGISKCLEYLCFKRCSNALGNPLHHRHMFSNHLGALSVLRRVNRTWFKSGSSCLWHQPLSSAKCQLVLGAIACPKRRQIYANKIVELQDVYLSIIFASFIPTFSSCHPKNFDYCSQIQLYCQSHRNIYGLYFSKLAYISLGINDSNTSLPNTALAKALCHLLSSQFQKLEYGLTLNVLQCLC